MLESSFFVGFAVAMNFNWRSVYGEEDNKSMDVLVILVIAVGKQSIVSGFGRVNNVKIVAFPLNSIDFGLR